MKKVAFLFQKAVTIFIFLYQHFELSLCIVSMLIFLLTLPPGNSMNTFFTKKKKKKNILVSLWLYQLFTLFFFLIVESFYKSFSKSLEFCAEYNISMYYLIK